MGKGRGGRGFGVRQGRVGVAVRLLCKVGRGKMQWQVCSRKTVHFLEGGTLGQFH